nr:hypothetical protein [Tanacetum cinerariifolium]
RIEEEQAANAQYWKILACCDDDDDYDSTITPNEPVDSLADYESDSSDEQSLSDEDFSEEIFSNPLFEEEIIPMKIDQHHFNAESDFIESMLNHDSSIIHSSLKIDSLLDEFAGELTLIFGAAAEECGNILNYGTCLNCNSGTGNSFTYDTIPESFDKVQVIRDPPPQFHFNIYSCQIYPLINHHCCYECGNSLNDFFCPHCTCEFCGNGAHVGYNCPAQVPSFQTLPSFPQQYPCCEDYRVLLETDHCQPPQYTVNHPIFNVHNDFLHSQNELTIAQNRSKKKRKLKKNKRLMLNIGRFPPAVMMTTTIILQSHQMNPLTLSVWGISIVNTISAMKSDEFIKSSVENLVPKPSESEGENGCDMSASFTTFSNILFDAEYEFDSSDDQSLSNEDFPDKIFSNLLFEEEIIPMKIDQHHFNVESDLIESLRNCDSSIISSSSKIDSLLDEFADELILLKSIPPGIDETDCYPEEDIRLIEILLYDNSSPRPPKEFVSENSNAEVESFSPSPIPVEDSDSFMEEIDLSFNPNDPMPSSIKDDDDDSERDILILEELPSNYSLSLPENESFHFNIPSFSHSLTKPPDGNTRILNIKTMGDNSKQKVPIHGLMITRVSNQEKSPDLLSHRSLGIFQLSAKCPMVIHGKNIPILDVPLFHFYPLDQFKYGGNWVKLSDLK